jgi:hypothetical protein
MDRWIRFSTAGARLPHRIGARGPDSRVHLLVECLEPVADLLLGLAGDLPPDPLPVWPEAERDRPHVPVPRNVEVDPVFAVPTVPDFHLGRNESLTLWLPADPLEDALSL